MTPSKRRLSAVFYAVLSQHGLATRAVTTSTLASSELREVARVQVIAPHAHAHAHAHSSSPFRFHFLFSEAGTPQAPRGRSRVRVGRASSLHVQGGNGVAAVERRRLSDDRSATAPRAAATTGMRARKLVHVGHGLLSGKQQKRSMVRRLFDTLAKRCPPVARWVFTTPMRC